MMTDVSAAITSLLQEMVASGEELGLQVAAYLNGELVIDTFAGIADRASAEPVNGDTLFTVFSTTKGVTATCIHLLAERGQLQYDDPIARYWPAFAGQGKARATVRDALTHKVGVPQLPADVTPEDFCDWDGICATIAAQAPLWEPGSRTGYHAFTFGWMLGEVLRRVDGRSIAEFVQDEICRPLGVRDLYLGIPDDAGVETRVAALESAPPPAGAPVPPPDALILQAIRPPVAPGSVYNRADLRRASIPGGGGIMSARAIARHYAALVGEVDGVRLLPSQRVATATELQTDEIDAVLGVPIRKALGYFLGGPLSPMGERASAFGHPGAGGSIGFADPRYRLAVGFTKNRLRTTLDPKEAAAYRVGQRVREVLGIPTDAGR